MAAVKIVKKHTTQFKRHQSDNFKRVSESWRKPKGIDGVVRRRFRGTIRMPKIGYGSNKKTKYCMPNGLKAFLVRNVADVELLLMQNRPSLPRLPPTCLLASVSRSLRRPVPWVLRSPTLVLRSALKSKCKHSHLFLFKKFQCTS
ncbi:60S ribosomal protein L32 [Schizosaccharomyces japonicus yFS275]|uniref:60S ribosomal protein L32 n=1 Tax=Schizosaccharomyces japonicus (strain yFS275 / FY16936) TaxID=402676 RepID=B6JYB9_SCHJY|nr:60S ribosomal protein L32 [Schizosaccharomyces japonicus yFS275]EEB06537.2 60S ribosomal protein L32 [Schizosaccharomyces japonicus yFS275]